jgi:hypothetical protein
MKPLSINDSDRSSNEEQSIKGTSRSGGSCDGDGSGGGSGGRGRMVLNDIYNEPLLANAVDRASGCGRRQ